MSTVKSPVYIPFEKGALSPQEEIYMLEKQHKPLKIGIPKENQAYESRIALSPQAVSILASQGHKILIESNAGEGANYADKQYTEAKGTIVHSKDEVYKANIILKISPFGSQDIEYIRPRQTLISTVQINAQNTTNIEHLMQRRVIALGYEYIKDEHDVTPVVQSMSEIGGTSAIMIASEYLSNEHAGKGVLLGGITGIRPTKVVIIGAGTAGEFAARTAIGLGALVTVFDNSIHRLRQLQRNLGQQIFTSVFQPRVLKDTLKNADVVIGAVNMAKKRYRFVVTEDMVRNMKTNAVIVDLSIDHGGCIETSHITSHKTPVFKKHGVIHYCVPNIASRVARTATIALSNIFVPVLMNIAEAGGVEPLLLEDHGLRQGVYIFNGILTNSFIGKRFGLPSKDINLLMAAY